MRRNALLAIGAAAASVALLNPAAASAGTAPTAAGYAPPGSVSAGYPPPGSVPAVQPAHRAHLTVIARHLANPRGVVLGPGGIVLVAEAGKGGSGPCAPDPEDPTATVCLGLTSGVTAIAFGKQHRIISGLPSLAAKDGSAGVGLDNIALGPIGLTGIVGLGGDPAKRAKLGKRGALMGHLVRLLPGRPPKSIADLVAYEAAHNPDAADPGSAVDSDPYDVISTPGGLSAVDAGGNDLLRVGPTGHVSTAAVFHARMVDAPPFLGLPPGTEIPMQAVPDALTCGRDGALYVGQLTGFPFPVGAANVYRVVPGHQPTVYASGFTNIISVAFDRAGNLYVLEIVKAGLLSDTEIGALIRVDRQGHRTEIAPGKLIAPGGLAIGARGQIYVSVNSIDGSKGEVVRIDQ